MWANRNKKRGQLGLTGVGKQELESILWVDFEGYYLVKSD